jgi:hypothetical protein
MNRQIITSMKYIKLSVFFILLVSVSVAFGSETNQLPKTLKYKLDIKIDYNADKLFGKCEIRVLNRTDQPIEKIPVILYRLLSVRSISDEDGTPLPFKQNIVNVTGWEKLQVNYIEITLIKSLSPGEQKTIQIDYDGYLLGYSNEGWRYVKDHIDRNFTIIRPDGFGYPVLGYPDEKEMMIISREQYDYLVNVTVPKGVQVVSGGELIKKVNNDTETLYSFKSKKPSWRLDIAISHYQLLKNGMDQVHYFKKDSIGAGIIINDFERAIKLYSGWFGELKNFQGYTIIEIPEGYSSQADKASILLTAEYFKTPPVEIPTLYHEASHLWNANSLDERPCRFESEGLAQFLEFLLAEKLDNKKNAVAEQAQSYMIDIRKEFTDNPEYQKIPVIDYGVKDITEYSYTVGMVAFAVYYNVVGSDQFIKMIRTFYSTYFSKGATTNDFINCCEKSVTPDTKKFFDDWIYTTNAMKLIVDGKSFKELVDYYKANQQ